MEHELLTVSSGFFSGVSAAHFLSTGGAGLVSAVPGLDDGDCGGWVQDLMQLGDELFGGGDASSAGMGGHHQPWQLDDSSPDGPPPSMSLEGDGSPPWVEQAGAGEPHRVGGGGERVSPTKRKKRDRSKMIVSERKRRDRMKEKLFELRSLVPNITKMDKASIIADAVVYVKNLQAHARKLREEVATLEARPMPPAGDQDHGDEAARRRQREHHHQGAAVAGARVTRVGATRVGERRFMVTVECERRDGVAAPLCAAVESLPCFQVESSSLGRSAPDRVVSTLTLKVSDQVGDATTTISEGKVKLWMIAALVKEGFRPEAMA
ncbi:hypothetical protein ACP70R_011666 [Stipagrostis hirtigluma subsp. patula]